MVPAYIIQTSWSLAFFSFLLNKLFNVPENLGGLVESLEFDRGSFGSVG
jgi:hypothetical protein